ncbi:phosphoserine phosphatase SerB [Acuticoccus sp. I52.16.1]|uniref:phosphoserine phosphatase SerB n=1 Tax=Acuticoccus sp. I52.16.1 TaxID=2928472 RepID=UPI001FD003E2|nr:phosphoserine phosphatase SerB [Acuticoccus sp. I52.16.1]UOM33382.1 phosphoserine phosphatase SerB [Acuticoccus sp. I52.16.1]
MIVVTLVAPGPLSPQFAASLVHALGAHRADRLDAHATDIYVDGERGAVRARTFAHLAAAGEAVDAIVQPVEERSKRLLICDMDSTLIGQECIDELAAVHGLKDRVGAITERAMRGELDFAAALTERVALLKGIPEASIDDLLTRVITPNPGAAELIAVSRANGIRTVLVSGGFTHFAEPVAARLGIDAAFANRLIAVDGVLSGTVADPILGSDEKRLRLLAECEALSIAPSAAVALGDGANDLAMVETAGLGIAYRPKPVLAKAADGCLAHCDLTAALYAMGIAPNTDAAASGV